MAINTTSSLLTPQAGDDSYLFDEDDLVDGQTLILDVMSNDSGGKAKVLWSIDDGYGNPIDPANLLSSDIGDGWEATAEGNWIRIYNGKIEYKLSDSGIDDINALAEGEFAVDTFTYSIRLANGTLSLATVTLTIEGNNDGPVISVGADDSDAKTLAETNAALSADGTLTVVDVDLSDTVTVAVDSVVASGTTTGLGSDDAALKAMMSVTADAIDADTGDTNNLAWSFASTPEVFDYLADGESLTLTYTVSASDGTASDTQVVTITITGTNDGPDITGTEVSAARNETDTTLTATGTLNVVDADLSDTVTVTVDSVAVDVTGTFGGNNPLSNDDLKAMMGVSPVTALNGDSTAGTDFDWTFTSGSSGNGAFNFLADGETLVLKYTLKATDDSGVVLNNSDTQVVTITITGSNDAPVVTAAVLATVDEDDANPATVNLLANASDPDLSDDVDTDSVAYSVTSGTWVPVVAYSVNNETGALTFDPNQFNALGVSESIELTFSYDVVDGNGGITPTTAVVTITGSNDAPVVTAAVLATVDEDDANPATVNLLANASDPDRTDDVDTASVSYSVTSGTWVPVVAYSVNNETGALTFDPNQFNALGASDTIELTFSYNVVDGNGGITPTTAVVTITGSADGLPALFTEGVDNRNFNGISAGSFDPTTYYNALGGADTVTLPNAVTAPADYDATNTFQGGAGNDTITGGDLADIIDGGLDNDSLIGGGSNDILVGGVGNDILNGGADGDTYRFALNAGTDTVSDTAGNDTIEILGGGAALSSLNFERVGGDLVVQYNGQQVTVQGHFTGGPGNDTDIENIVFTGGATFMGYSLGTSSYNLDTDLTGAGSDDVIASTAVGQVMNGGGGNGDDLLFGNNGDDNIVGGGGSDLMVGGGGNDAIDAGGTGDQDVIGYSDILDGGTLGDTVTQFDADATGGQDFIDLDALFDELGFSNTDRAAGAGYDTTVSGITGVVWVDTDNNNATGTVGAPAGGYDLKLVTITTITSATFDDTDVRAGSL